MKMKGLMKRHLEPKRQENEDKYKILCTQGLC